MNNYKHKTDRQHAIDAGDRYYYGPACPDASHTNDRGYCERHVSSKQCVECKNIARQRSEDRKLAGLPMRAIRHPAQPVSIEFIEGHTDTDPSTGCWIWRRSQDGSGYGKVRFEGRYQPVHVVVYKLVHGAVPDDCVVSHSCQHDLCANPEHLIAKPGMGRVLTEEDVIEIRERLALGETGSALALWFGVTDAAISYIRTGKTWRDLRPIEETATAA